MKKYWIRYSIFFLLLFISYIGEATFVPFLLKDFSLRLTEFSSSIDKNFISYIKPFLIIYIYFFFIKEALGIIAHLIKRPVAAKIRVDMQLALVNYVEQHSVKYFSEHAAGKLLQKINDVTSSFSLVIELLLDSCFLLFLTVILNGGFLFTIDFSISMVLLLWFIIHVSWTVFMVNIINKSELETAEANSELSGKIVDSFNNYISVKVFGVKNGNKYIRLYANIWEKKKIRNIINYQKLWMPLAMFAVFSFGVLIFKMSTSFAAGKISSSDMVFTLTAYTLIYSRIWWFTFSAPEIIRSIATVNQALSTILIPTEIKDVPNATSLKINDATVEFKGVSFKYKNNWVFKNFNLKVTQGEKVGIVGRSGAGKTTLMNLLLRFYEIDSGKILIDGKDIKNVTQESLREHISFVAQDTTMFDRTVMENIAYSHEDASFSIVKECAKQANADNFIECLTQGYDTIVGERGVKLSGGQRQRISIARTLLKNSPIVILDEATSALDSETEKFIQDNLLDLLKGKTTFVIAHRLSTLKNMDRIIVVEDGKIVEEGTHAKLLKEKGEYYKLWSMQSNGFMLEED